jgi:hypothetical protein
MKRQVFYSFHYDNDVMRVQQIRNIGALEGNTPVSANDWETLKRNGDTAIKNWIDNQLKYKNCLIVLIGSQTANRPWVKYEIQRAWELGKAVLGIHIHNIKCPRNGISVKGKNPFSEFTLNNNNFANYVDCYDPNPSDAYNDIRLNIENWIERAIQRRKTA